MNNEGLTQKEQRRTKGWIELLRKGVRKSPTFLSELKMRRKAGCFRLGVTPAAFRRHCNDDLNQNRNTIPRVIWLTYNGYVAPFDRQTKNKRCGQVDPRAGSLTPSGQTRQTDQCQEHGLFGTHSDSDHSPFDNTHHRQNMRVITRRLFEDGLWGFSEEVIDSQSISELFKW